MAVLFSIVLIGPATGDAADSEAGGEPENI
jgi:hypothetical protein